MTTESARDSGKAPPRWVLKTMTRVHVLLHRVTGGGLNRLGGFRNYAGLPMTTTTLSSLPHRDLQSGIRVRLARLEQFLTGLGSR